MLVLGLHSKDRKCTRDKTNISNLKVSRGCPPLTANPISADCKFHLDPQYNILGFNAMWVTSLALRNSLHPANEILHYIVMSSLIGWLHTHNDPWYSFLCCCVSGSTVGAFRPWLSCVFGSRYPSRGERKDGRWHKHSRITWRWPCWAGTY